MLKKPIYRIAEDLTKGDSSHRFLIQTQDPRSGNWTNTLWTHMTISSAEAIRDNGWDNIKPLTD